MNERRTIETGKRYCLRKLSVLITLSFLLIAGLHAQTTRRVTGTLTDETGEPLIGASVVEKGTTNGSMTNIDGEFELTINEANATLEVTYIGYKPLTVALGDRTTVTLMMQEDTEVLEEVVVVGYGVQKKKLVTGATAQVKGENIAKLNTTNPLQAMQGQMPGVSISSTSGQPGSDMKVNIRGLGTVGNSGPLYLIDGIGGDISTLNPSDIESIDVLKDAASAAIYGAQAANGVVLITTKSGREGKAVVSFDAYYGIQNVARKANMLNAQQYMTIMDEQALNSGNGVFNWAGMQSIRDANGTIYDTDWVDTMFKEDAKTESYTLSVAGGSATSTYAISLGYMNQEGVVGGKDVSNYERFNFRINSEHKLFNNRVKVGEQVSFVYKQNTGIGVGNQYNNTLRGAFGTSPITPVYSDNNTYDSPYNDTSNSDWYNGDGNPYGSMMTNTNNIDKNGTFSGNLYAEIEPLKNLKIRTVLGAVYGTSDYRSFSPLYHFSIYSYSDTRTSVSQNMNRSLGLTWTNTASYDFNYKEHNFSALLGMESYRYEGTYLGAGSGSLKEGFDSWPYAYIGNGTASSSTEGLSASGNPHDEGRSVSYFGRIGWNWKETYMVNATLRADGSSRFASGNRFGYFPSVSAGWTISNESFMEETRSWLDFLKLRASWGQVGNQNISNYQYLAPIKNTNTHYLFGSGYGDADAASQLGTNWGAYPSRLANEAVTWETSEQTNIGIDARFLNSRLGLNADFYIKETKDWLVEAPILATVGAGAPFINGGSVKNTGVELMLTWNDNIGRDFRYNIGINGAYNKNEVGQIPTEDGIIHGSTNQLYDNTPEFYRAQNGMPIGYFWGYKTAGIFQNTQEIADWIAAGNGVLQNDVQPGDVKYIDIDHNGVINEADKVDLGNGMPDVTFGFNLGFEYKGLDLSIVANGAAGQQIVQSYRGHTNKYANYTTAILDRWTGEGTSNRIPRVTEQNINWQFSDLYVQDADFLRISNITLGYDLARLIKRNVVSQLRIYAQVQNAFTFTKYDGMDPEVGYGTDKWVSGVDVGYYPRPRTFLLGVNLKF
ncbi:TonB-dependent receptor [Parabacteroides sp. OttesenSCG-928-N08]|nr:TonB-dependent receptor [Parabacteroides sp. OttesenSCG-928-N08]